MLRRSFAVRALALSAALVLLAPAAALADTFNAAGKGLPDSVGINSIWVIVAGCLVMFMQAGFAFLEIGFSRGKNAGTGIAKILTNFSIASIAYWAVGFALAFGGAGTIAGTHGFFLDVSSVPSEAAKQFPFVYLFDESQQIAKAYGATSTPEFFILDRTRRVVYMGGVDEIGRAHV